MTMTELQTRYRRHLAIVDRDVAMVVARYRQHIQCRSGCSDCCHQTFRISSIEGAYLREGLENAPKDVQQDILERARNYVPSAHKACPVLSDEGSCRLYEHRPRICRKYGIPLWHPDRPHEVTTCKLNFRNAQDVDAELILEPQAEWARDWILLQEGHKPDAKTTIAEQLLLAEPRSSVNGFDVT